MARTKERRKILHNPSTQEIFQCLQEIPTYSRILVENTPKTPFIDFLRWLIDTNFYNEKPEKISIKRLATDFKTDPTKVAKWIKQIYEEIFNLNDEKPQLFQKNGIKITLYIKSYDNYCSFCTTLPILPREFETFRFPFVQARVGTDYFWIKKVEHEINDNVVTINLRLEGGFLNKYREFALDKALFQGEIGFMDVYQKHPFELDEEIKKIYRN